MLLALFHVQQFDNRGFENTKTNNMENIKQFSRVENIMTNHEQFHPLPQCFQKSSAAEASKRVCMWKMVIGTDVLFF